jgi:hypothetical protein
MAGSRGWAGRLFGLGMALMGSAQAGTLSASGTTLNIDLDVASQLVTLVSTGSTYTFTLSGGATNPWAGSGTRTAASATVLTITPWATYDTNAYVDDFKVTLDNTRGGGGDLQWGQ